MAAPILYQVLFTSNPTVPNEVGDIVTPHNVDEIFDGLDYFEETRGVNVGQLVYGKVTSEPFRMLAWEVVGIGYNSNMSIPVYYLDARPEKDLYNFSDEPCVDLVFGSFSTEYENATVGVPYDVDIEFSAGAPLSLESVVLGANIVATISGSKVELRGTPEAGQEGSHAQAIIVSGCNGSTYSVGFDLLVAASE